ncbi:ABC transporter permease [Flavimaricola marinus]|uniref:Putative aliphatic sulfonates transport permease protein SsuC n=1 Tax=Flavimaricola marinus TaxID=1819565 RepID=A0A238LEF1_9RHOB|nr:ABC transporter permease [Flavimaricola marinus]SMY08087.1 Putative aliphatic sulfonates transport permease protein SsuC [Flavimaricola marinus]
MSITENTDVVVANETGAGPLFDAEEERYARAQKIEAVARWVVPMVVLSLTIWLWDRVVVWNEIPHYVLPGPGLVLSTLFEDRVTLFQSLLVTLQITFMALTVAILGGVGLAVLFTQSKFAEMSFSPFAVILQVTPIVSIAPLIFIYVESRLVGLLLCAWIVAFFPILANTTLGLKSADHNLRDLMNIYKATRWQRLRFLQLPSALPYFLGGLRIAGGLALIGAVVAEYVAGTGGIGSGLAFRILEAGYRLNIPRMFAALLLIALTGVVIFATTSLISHLALRKWHESAVKRE